MAYRIAVRARYAETDQLGIVHHSVYPVWYEAARSEWIREVGGISYGDIEAMGVYMPLLEMTSRFYKPVKYDQLIEIEIRLLELSPAKVFFEYLIYCEDKEMPVNRGTTLHAWIDDSFKVLNLKKHCPQLYQLLEGLLYLS